MSLNNGEGAPLLLGIPTGRRFLSSRQHRQLQTIFVCAAVSCLLCALVLPAVAAAYFHVGIFKEGNLKLLRLKASQLQLRPSAQLPHNRTHLINRTHLNSHSYG